MSRILPKVAVKAIELKYLGVSYEDIGKQIGKSTSWVSHAFYSGGELQEEYLKYEEEQFKAMKDEAKRLLRRNVRNAVMTLLNEAKNGDKSSARIKAAIEILDRVMPEDKITETPLSQILLQTFINNNAAEQTTTSAGVASSEGFSPENTPQNNTQSKPEVS